MFRTVDGKQFALYVGQDGTHCAMMTYDATANRFGIGLVNHPDTITLNDDGTVTIPDMVTRAVVEEMLSKFAETVYHLTGITLEGSSRRTDDEWVPRPLESHVA